MTTHDGESSQDKAGPQAFWIINGVAAAIAALALWGGFALDQFLPDIAVSGRGDSRMTLGIIVVIFAGLIALFVLYMVVQGVLVSRLLRVASTEHADSFYVGVVQTRWQEKTRFVHSGGWISALPFAGVLVFSTSGVRFLQPSSQGDIVLPWSRIVDVTTEAATAASKPGRIILRLAEPDSRFPFSPLDRQWTFYTRPHRRAELIEFVSQIARGRTDAASPQSPGPALPQRSEETMVTPISPRTSPPAHKETHRASSYDARQVHRGISAFRLQRLSFIAGVASAGSGLFAFVLLSLGDARVPFIPIAAVLIFGPPLASYVFHVMARIESNREFDRGYTSYRDKFIDLDQRHPVSGEIIRDAGKPFLSDAEWGAVYPGPGPRKEAGR